MVHSAPAPSFVNDRLIKSDMLRAEYFVSPVVPPINDLMSQSLEIGYYLVLFSFPVIVPNLDSQHEALATSPLA